MFKLGWLPGTSAMTGGFNPVELVLPVPVLVLYDFGYVARMTRASMAEVMTSQYIRTAMLKGLPRRRVIVSHALRNALIAPFTVIVLQLNWLLSGVIVVEVFFAYKGFGKLLFDAATFGDIYLIEACTLVAVFVAVLSQFISDIGYTLPQPAHQVQLRPWRRSTPDARRPRRPSSAASSARWALLRESPLGMLGVA